jgi:DNA-binding NarL/FixJ family response regulator
MTAVANRIRVVVADDHTLLREGLRELLCTDPTFAVVADAATGQQAIAQAAELLPDLLLLDVQMPGPGAEAVIEQVKYASPFTKIIVVTMHDDPMLVYQLMECGASAYLIKTIARSELLAAVHAVCRDEDTVLLSVSRRTIEHLDPRQSKPAMILSRRELEVLGGVARALTNAQIATELYITESTVKRHLTNIYAKLGAVSRVDAIRKARADGVIPPDPTTR